MGLSAPALGSGFGIFEHGAKATGLAGAFVAQVYDPSAIFYNPAGITHLTGTQIYLGTTLIIPQLRFAGMSPYPGYGVTEETKFRIFYPPTFYITHAINEKLHVGFGVFSPYGLATDWKNPKTFTGRFISQRTEIQSFYLNPTVGFKASEKFSFAAGVNLVFSKVELEKNIPLLDPTTQKTIDLGHLFMKGSSSLAIGWNVGALAKPTDKLSIGLAYRSSVTNDFEGTADFTFYGLGIPAFDQILQAQFPEDQDGSTSIRYPWMILAGVSYQVTEKLLVEFDFNREGWSVYDTLKLEFKKDPSLNTSIPEAYEDVNYYRLGVSYSLSDQIALRFGYLYEDNPVPVESVGPMLPDANRNGFTIGLGLNFGAITIDLADMIVLFDKRSTEGKNREGFEGEYRASANLIALSLGYKF